MLKQLEVLEITRKQRALVTETKKNNVASTSHMRELNNSGHWITWACSITNIKMQEATTLHLRWSHEITCIFQLPSIIKFFKTRRVAILLLSGGSPGWFTGWGGRTASSGASMTTTRNTRRRGQTLGVICGWFHSLTVAWGLNFITRKVWGGSWRHPAFEVMIERCLRSRSWCLLTRGDNRYRNSSLRWDISYSVLITFGTYY